MPIRCIAVFLFGLMLSSAAWAQRVFVASTGTDTGTCNRTAPCRTFAYAITQAVQGGELVALDTAGYGPVTITSSISIYAAPGEVASITSNGTPAITVAATSTDSVNIRGLFLSAGPSDGCIRFDSGNSLRVADTTFSTGEVGLWVIRPANGDFARVSVVQSRFRTQFGINTQTPGGTISLTVANCDFSGESDGMFLQDDTRATVTDSTFTGNTVLGLYAAKGNVNPLQPMVTVERCTFVGNGNALWAFGTNTLIRLAYSTVLRNAVGIEADNGAGVATRIDNLGSDVTNTIEGNANGNSPAGNYTAK